MKRNLIILLLGILLTGCAADVSKYEPPLDPALITPATKIHLTYCRNLVAKQPKESIWGTIGSQVTTSSGNGWLSALELGTSTAMEAAAGSTVLGLAIGTHTGLSSRQTAAESMLRKCMANYEEPLLTSP